MCGGLAGLGVMRAYSAAAAPLLQFAVVLGVGCGAHVCFVLCLCECVCVYVSVCL